MDDENAQDRLIELLGLILGSILFFASVVLINAAIVMLTWNHLISYLISANDVTYVNGIAISVMFILFNFFNNAGSTFLRK